MTRAFPALSHRCGPDRYYDAVVIGSGIGGLVCANLLAAAGLKVLIVEQHTMVGGYCSGFRRKGFLFDAASHFYPLLGNDQRISGRVLHEIGSTTRWLKMDPVDQFHLPDGSRFSVPADFQDYIEQLKQLFPSESLAIDQFFRIARKLYFSGILYFFQNCKSHRLDRYLSMTVRDALDQIFKSEKLKLLLTADCPHWGSPPSETSFVFDSMLRLSYFEGNYYPAGGSQAFADELAARLHAHGGHILMQSLVRRIVVTSGRATALEIEIGPIKFRTIAKVNAGCVISNADMRQTVSGMIGEEHFPAKYVATVKALRPSYSCFLSHIGVRGIPTETLERVHGYYWQGWNSDRVGSDAFLFKLFVPTLYEPTLAPPGGHVLIVQKVIDFDYDSVSDWQAHKTKIEKFVLAGLERIIPGISDCIVVCESASAKTSQRFTLNYQGAMLGWRMSPEQLGEQRPSIESPIEGLYFVGQWTRPGGGITPAIISAMNVARRLTGRNDSRAAWPAADRSPPAERFEQEAVEVAS